MPVDALIFAGGGWLSAALLLYAVSPSFLAHPYRNFIGLRFAVGVVVFPAIAVAGVFLITGQTELACAVGIPAGGLLYVGGSSLERLLMARETKPPGQSDDEPPPFTPVAAAWLGSALALAIATFALVLLIFS